MSREKWLTMGKFYLTRDKPSGLCILWDDEPVKDAQGCWSLNNHKSGIPITQYKIEDGSIEMPFLTGDENFALEVIITLTPGNYEQYNKEYRRCIEYGKKFKDEFHHFGSTTKEVKDEK